MATISRPNNEPTPSTRAQPVELVVSDTGTVEAGALSIGFINRHASAACTINGASLAAGESKTYPFVGKQYVAISYVATGSSLAICAIF